MDKKIKTKKAPTKDTETKVPGSKAPGSDFFERFWEESWVYIKTVVNVIHEPILILNDKLMVMAANEAFYQKFRVKKENTEGKILYQLGDGQWDIESLRKMLETILPKDTFFNGFEVAHDFPSIGKKIMILNARKIYPTVPKEGEKSDACPPIILLAFEDVTEMMSVADKLSGHLGQFEVQLTERTKQLELQIEMLQKKVHDFRKHHGNKDSEEGHSDDKYEDNDRDEDEDKNDDDDSNDSEK